MKKANKNGYWNKEYFPNKCEQKILQKKKKKGKIKQEKQGPVNLPMHFVYKCFKDDVRAGF